MEASKDISRLIEIMEALRQPETGCPWDVVQTFETIKPYTIEEAYEVADAIERRDMDDLCDELGDLLLQVVFHARIAEERGEFGFVGGLRAERDRLEELGFRVADATISSASPAADAESGAANAIRARPAPPGSSPVSAAEKSVVQSRRAGVLRPRAYPAASCRTASVALAPRRLLLSVPSMASSRPRRRNGSST